MTFPRFKTIVPIMLDIDSTLLPREFLKRYHTRKMFGYYDVTVKALFMSPHLHLRLRNDFGK